MVNQEESAHTPGNNQQMEQIIWVIGVKLGNITNPRDMGALRSIAGLLLGCSSIHKRGYSWL